MVLCKTSWPQKLRAQLASPVLPGEDSPGRLGTRPGDTVWTHLFNGSPATKDLLGSTAHTVQRTARKPFSLSPPLCSNCPSLAWWHLNTPLSGHISTQARVTLKFQTLGPSPFKMPSTAHMQSSPPCRFAFPLLVSNLTFLRSFPELFNL